MKSRLQTLALTVLLGAGTMCAVQAEDSANLALNKTATASSTEGDGYAAGQAVDGNAETRWSSAFEDPQWFQVDLGAVQAVGKVIIKWENASGKDFKIQTSLDGKNWTDSKEVTGGEGGTQEITFNPTRAQFLRLAGTARNTEFGYSIFEFEVYAK